jgi:hypothetical protein
MLARSTALKVKPAGPAAAISMHLLSQAPEIDAHDVHAQVVEADVIYVHDIHRDR